MVSILQCSWGGRHSTGVPQASNTEEHNKGKGLVWVVGTGAHVICLPHPPTQWAHLPVGLRGEGVSPACSKHKCSVNGGVYDYYLLRQGGEGKSPWGTAHGLRSKCSASFPTEHSSQMLTAEQPCLALCHGLPALSWSDMVWAWRSIWAGAC